MSSIACRQTGVIETLPAGVRPNGRMFGERISLWSSSGAWCAWWTPKRNTLVLTYSDRLIELAKQRDQRPVPVTTPVR
jgi:catabolite regulation protein CreA